MRAPDGIRPVRDQAAQTFGGSPTVDEWEIAVLHRDHPSGPGAGVRATWLTVRPDQFDRAIEFYRESVLPAIEELEGFCSASLMIDRTSWRAVSSSTFDSLEAMERNEDQARSLRTAGFATSAPTSSTSASSNWQSPTCGCPSWSSRVVFASPRSTLEQLFAKFLALASISA